jgi:tetratricopeptide (TPR) repeat protein
MKAAGPLLLMLLAAGASLAQTSPGNPQPQGQVPQNTAKPAAGVRPLDGLLTALRAAPTEEAAAAIEAQISALWQNAASPAIRLLLSRGARELSEAAATEAFESFDAALDLDPDLLEAWRGRAQARLRMGDPAGAARDIQEVLRREPRHFAAWQDLSRIAEARGDWRGALAAWQKMLESDPRSPGAKERLKDLRRRALGEDA